MSRSLPPLAKRMRASASRLGKATFVLALLHAALLPPLPAFADEAERFKDTEIRVIRPRFFNKAKRFELGAAMNAIMNESFIYTFMASGLATYHINEDWAIEVSLSYGLNLDREDKRVLFDEFDIKTQIFRTQYQAELAIQWTPVYGKWQLPSGKLVYFDTFLTGGIGQTGVEWRYDDFCEAPAPDDPNAEPLPGNQTKGYPTFMLGVGQRYFVSKTQAYRFDLKGHHFLYDRLDGECSPISAAQTVTGTAGHDVITLLLGISRFF